jgi:hypothetical protein
VSSTQAFDANLFATGNDRTRQEDFFARLGSTIEAGYESAPLAVTARYGFDAEGYLHHPSLNRALARQDAVVELHRRATRRLTVDVKGSYFSTHNPSELNVGTSLVSGRTRADRVAALSVASFQWTPATAVDAEYTFTRDVVQGGISSTVHEAMFGTERGGTSSRNVLRLEYRLRDFQFSDGQAEVWHLVAARWTRDLTRRTELELTGGPRVADGTVRPELGARLRRAFPKGELSGGYFRTQATAFGEAGVIDVQRVDGLGLYRATRRVTLSAAPTYAASVLGADRVTVYALDVEAKGHTRGGLSLALVGRLGLQRGTLEGRPSRIPVRSVALRMAACFPARANRATPVEGDRR